MLNSIIFYFKKIASTRSLVLAFAVITLILPFQNCFPTALKTSASSSITSVTSSQGQNSSGTNSPPRVTVPIPAPTIPTTPNGPVVALPNTPTTPPVVSIPGSVAIVDNSNSEIMASNSVIGIQPNQIFQRKDSNLQATIEIKMNSVNAFRSELPYYSISLLSNEANLATVKTEKVLVSGQRLSLSAFNFEVATGMAARRIKFSLHDTRGVEQQRWVSPSFSVGEIFLVSGQSNSATHGEAPTSSINSLNRAIDPTNQAWVPLNDPMPYASSWAVPPWSHPNLSGGSPWPSFADRFSSLVGVPVGVVSVGWGGSAVAWWKPGDTHNLFPRLVLGAQAVPSCGFRAVLWHQGESDSVGKTSASEYQQSLQTVVNSFRSVTGCQQNWMIARATYNYPEAWSEAWGPTNYESVAFAAQSEIRKAQNIIARLPTFKVGPDSDMLIGPVYRWDRTHLSVSGLKLHGALWAKYLTDEQSAKTDLLIEKNLVPEVQTIFNLYQSILNRNLDEVASDTEGVRYWINVLSFKLKTEAELAIIFKDSDEAYVRLTYSDVLGRRPTMDELNTWIRKLSSKEIASRADLKIAIQKLK